MVRGLVVIWIVFLLAWSNGTSTGNSFLMDETVELEQKSN